MVGIQFPNVKWNLPESVCVNIHIDGTVGVDVELHTIEQKNRNWFQVLPFCFPLCTSQVWVKEYTLGSCPDSCWAWVWHWANYLPFLCSNCLFSNMTLIVLVHLLESLLLLFCLVPGIKLTTSCLPGRHCAAKLYSGPYLVRFWGLN